MCACQPARACAKCAELDRRYLNYQYAPVETEMEREDRLTQEAQTVVVHDRNATA